MAKEPNLMEFARTANAGTPKLRSAVPTQRPPPPTANVAVVPVVPTAPAVPRDSSVVVLSLSQPAPIYAPAAPQQFSVPLARPSPVRAVVLVTAGVLGLVLTLYRNDVFYGLTHSSRWEHSYLGLESALGSPGFGTPRSLDAMIHKASAATSAEAPSALVNVVNQAAEPKPSAPIAQAAAPAAAPAQGAAEEADPAPSPGAKARAKPAAIASRHGRPAATHAAAESEEAPPKKAAAPEPDEELPKKTSVFGLPPKAEAKKAEAKKASESKDTAPNLNLNDAIKASMEK